MLTSKVTDWYFKLKGLLTKDKNAKEIAKGGFVAFIINLAGLGFGYLFIILISRVFKNDTAEIYGKYVLVTLLLRIGSILTRFGTDTAMLQQTAGLASLQLWTNIKRINKKLLNINIILGVFITLVLILLAGEWSKLFKLDHETVIVAGFFVLPMALGLFYSQSLRGLKKIGISSFLQNSSLPVFNFFLFLILIPFFKPQTPGFKQLPVITFYISVFITLILGMIYWRRSINITQPQETSFDLKRDKSYKQLFKLSYPLLLAESMVFIIIWVNQLMLGVFGTPKDVGIFNLCIKYAMLAALPLKAITMIAAPKFSEFHFNDDKSNLAKLVMDTTRVIFWISIPVVIIYLLFPSFCLNIFGGSFSEGKTALIILACASLINVMTGDCGTLLQMTGKQVVLQNILSISLVVNITLNAVLIPLYGITGAAVTSFVSTCVINLSMTWYIKKHFGFYSIYFPFLFKKNS